MLQNPSPKNENWSSLLDIAFGIAFFEALILNLRKNVRISRTICRHKMVLEHSFGVSRRISFTSRIYQLSDVTFSQIYVFREPHVIADLEIITTSRGFNWTPNWGHLSVLRETSFTTSFWVKALALRSIGGKGGRVRTGASESWPDQLTRVVITNRLTRALFWNTKRKGSLWERKGDKGELSYTSANCFT